MTDYFKTIRAYLRGKWGCKSRPVSESGSSERETFTVTLSDGMISDAFMAVTLEDQIARLKRAKKKHSHLQKQLDDLLNGGAQISDQQMETTK